MRRFSLLLLAFSALAATPAGAASIYYQCSTGICRISPSGGSPQTVVTGDYRSPSVSLDGAHVAWIQNTADLFTGNGAAGDPIGPITRFAAYAVISPDGTQVLAFEAAGQPTRVCVYDTAGGSCHSQGGGAITSAGWYPGNRVMVSTRESDDPAFQAHAQYYNNEICLEVAEGGGQCEKTVARDTDYQLDDPALSPDGTTLAIARSPWDHQDQRQIALYDASTGAFEKVLTSGPGDETPFWSPDGSQIAFSRDGGIYVVGAGGAPGSERRIADGNSPTWSLVGGATSPPKASLKRTQRGTKVRGTVTTLAGSRVEIDLVVQGYLVGRKINKGAPGGKLAFTVPLVAKLVKALRSHHVHKVPVTVRILVGSAQIKRKVTLLL